LNFLFSLLKFEGDALFLLFETLSLNFEVIDEHQDILLFVIHLCALFSELIDFIDLVLLLWEADNGIFLVLILVFLIRLFLFFRFLIVLAVAASFLFLSHRTGSCAVALALADLLHFLEICSDYVVLVTALSTQLVKFGH